MHDALHSHIHSLCSRHSLSVCLSSLSLLFSSTLVQCISLAHSSSSFTHTDNCIHSHTLNTHSHSLTHAHIHTPAAMSVSGSTSPAAAGRSSTPPSASASHSPHAADGSTEYFDPASDTGSIASSAHYPTASPHSYPRLPLSILRSTASSPDLSRSTQVDTSHLRGGTGSMGADAFYSSLVEGGRAGSAAAGVGSGGKGSKKKHILYQHNPQDPMYRLAAAKSTEHREQELAWQWHVYRLKTTKQKIDSAPPASFKLLRDPDRVNSPLKFSTSQAFRQNEIQIANNALVARIRTQKSTYGFKAGDGLHATYTLMSDSRTGPANKKEQPSNSSNNAMGSRTSQNAQRKIAMDNAKLLRTLQSINSRAGPYNRDKIHGQIYEHERLQ